MLKAEVAKSGKWWKWVTWFLNRDMVCGAITPSLKESRCHGVFLLCFAYLVAYLGVANELTSDFPDSHASGSQYQH